jgi:hypothetical protein
MPTATCATLEHFSQNTLVSQIFLLVLKRIAQHLAGCVKQREHPLPELQDLPKKMWEFRLHEELAAHDYPSSCIFNVIILD